MALTKDFKENVIAWVKTDLEFATALLDEAATLFLNGEPDTAKLILRDLVNATIGFEQLARSVEKPPKSVHQMLSPAGNPTMSSLAAIFAVLKKASGYLRPNRSIETDVESSFGRSWATLGRTARRRSSAPPTVSLPLMWLLVVATLWRCGLRGMRRSGRQMSRSMASTSSVLRRSSQGIPLRSRMRGSIMGRSASSPLES